MRGKLFSGALALFSMVALVHCVGDDPALVTETPTDEAGAGVETGGMDAATASDTGGGSDTSSSDGGDGSTRPKQAFVTDAVFLGNMSIAGGAAGAGGVAAADMHCMEAAASTFPGRTFHALIAATGVNAFTHIGSGPWYIGANRVGAVADLMGGKDPLTPLNITESGKVLTTSSTAWVGAQINGDADVGYSCLDWSDATNVPAADVATIAGTGGTWFYADVSGCNNTRHLYCFEQ